MQTIYFETTHFIRHTGNLVDLTEYRRKLEQIRQEEAGGAGEHGRPGGHGTPCPPAAGPAG